MTPRYEKSVAAVILLSRNHGEEANFGNHQVM